MAEGKSSKAKSEDTEADEPTVAELKERAAELDISGRTQMNKEELQAAIEIAETAAPQDTDTRYPRQRFLDESAAFLGVKAPVAAGALATLPGDGDLTVDEVKAAVERFLSEPQKEG